MASLEQQIYLPTLSKLGVTNPPKNIDASKIVTEWSDRFFKALSSDNVDETVSLILEDGLWRDMLAITWNFRTIFKSENIRKLLNARLAQTKITNLKLSEDKDKQPALVNPNPELIWIQAFFDFETSVGLCSGVFRLVPTPNGEWKAHTVYTNLEGLKGFPPKAGPYRSHESNHGFWESQRAKETAYEDREPTVLIVGGGQSGLEVAVRLKYLGVSCLIVEKNARIGDNWRNRYNALCLHDSLADWLEFYAHSLELDYWTSSEVTSVQRDGKNGEWAVSVAKSDGSKRIFHTKYVVLALGLGGNTPKMPVIPGMDKFKGKIRHSIHHKRALDDEGKKVVVVGACTSAHDISQDYQHYGVDVTMVQRSSTCIVSVKKGMPLLFGDLYKEGGPPVDICDRINASFPIYLQKCVHQMVIPAVMEADKEVVEGLKKVGFKINYGPDDSGWTLMAWKNAGGYYLEVGASQLIIDGKIKLKNGSIKEFTEDSLVFEDGSTLKADVVVFATGYGNAHDATRKIFPSELVDKMKPIWGLTDEGEIQGIWTESGVSNVYFMLGNLALCRFHSTHIALQIKAKEEGLFTTVYDE
ncbi:hypothetical protein Clacol_008915 [Clathrus columnatus]|uniref:Flavin-containing monooxygenase n=1 Tax=Clathrus columnatus TaxID=1419009 RepID=A0AAV5APN0_9AGAM|nr:hypothetical protein Clacol_008915 [Clathrus columnatus]